MGTSFYITLWPYVVKLTTSRERREKIAFHFVLESQIKINKKSHDDGDGSEKTGTARAKYKQCPVCRDRDRCGAWRAALCPSFFPMQESTDHSP
jgi:hypothetical protein